ncbi:TlpA family protein disulfide reductase [Prolixibacteraceae bacterium JC049]|nr:TlpA family protein disulfide reductase [Prolixibacteraceae bacterium JC049]
MKKMHLLIALLLLAVGSVSAQVNLSKIQLKSTDGKVVKFSEVIGKGKPVVLSFWATWCKPCISELEAISEVYDDWKDEADFEFYAISIDDSRSYSKVKSLANGKAWPFEVLLDDKHELKQMLGLNSVPFMMIFDKKGNVAHKHLGYTPGSEENIFDELLELNK